MRYAPLIAALAAALTTSPASATIRIAGDAGGRIGTYLKRIEAMRQSGERRTFALKSMVRFGKVSLSRVCHPHT